MYLMFLLDLHVLSSTSMMQITFQMDGNLICLNQSKEKDWKACQTSGNIREPEVANRILEDGEADLIAIGRGLIADPEWVNKFSW